MPKLWTTPAPPPEDLVFDLLDVPPFIVQTLYNRQLRSIADIRRFLAGDGEDTGDPYALAGMEAAVSRLQRALADREKIAVYGDFDVDGVCSAALLVHALRGMGGLAEVYIPHRVEEGYGLNQNAIALLAHSGITLMVTADCGTSSVRDIAYAGSLGMDVIVTDHHHVPLLLPQAVAVINPHRPDCRYEFKELAGVGVAYRLAQALAQRQHAQLSTYVDLVALGTVVDVAPLVGENRCFARLGLALMNQSPRPGLRALMSVARISTLDAGRLSFILGPRLNAAGRMDSAYASYNLLMSGSMEEAEPLAQTLEAQNLERQKLLESALAIARQDAAAQATADLLIFVAAEDFRAGIVGLVAQRLAEEFYRPAIAVERGESLCRGSCRSVPPFHIAQALDECSDILERHGGHAQAAGFTVRTERLAELRRRLAAIAQREFADHPPEPLIVVDAQIPISQATWDTLSWLRRMEPFGPGNPAPVFRSNGVRVRNLRPTGNGHVRLLVSDGRVTWSAIAFRQSSLLGTIKDGDRVDIVYNLEEQTWNGERSLQLVIKDLRM